MKIINNRNSDNHLKKLITSFSDANEIIIVSPFISEEFDFFPFKKLTHLKKIRLITHLKPFTADQYGKVKFLKKLFAFGREHNIVVETFIDNSLHGKIYVCLKDGHYIEGLITSANFTRNGLKLNNEWGVCIDSPIELEALVKNLFNHIVLEQLTDKRVDEFEKILSDNPLGKQKREVGVDLAQQLILKINPLDIVSQATFWLKPIGVTGNVIKWGEPHSDLNDDLHFSVKPNGVKPGHIILTYAVGHANFLSVYRVISEVHQTGKAGDRWRYYVIGENLTPYYGGEWHKHGLTITNQKNEAIHKNIGNVTPSGKNSFGSLMRGADKLRLTSTFANYVINKITSINEHIESGSI